MKTRLLLSALAFCLLPLLVQATHIKSSYISYTRDAQNPRKLHFTLTLYTNHFSQAEDPEVEVRMGDGNRVIVPRASVVPYSKNHDQEIFNWTYTYAMPGMFTVAWWNENNNNGIINLPQPSDQLAGYVYTDVIVGGVTANLNNGIQLAGAPVLEAYTGEAMRHNLLAYDLDGDQLSYQLVAPKTTTRTGEVGYIGGYRFPEGLTINQFGELYWENPGTKGQYLISLLITERREGRLMGSTVVDMTFNVSERTEQPRMQLVNRERLTINSDGSIQVGPEQPLKLEFYLHRGQNNTSNVSSRLFSELDTLNLVPLTMAVRDTTDGLAITLTFTPGPELERPSPYLLGMRGANSSWNVNDPNQHWHYLEHDWAFAYVRVGNMQPTSIGDDLAKLGFSLYPNPIAEKFVIQAPNMPAMQLLLFDVTGKKVKVLQLNSGKNYVARPAALAGGLYFYTLTSRNAPVGSGRLLIR